MTAFRTGGETQLALAVAAGTTRLEEMPRRRNNSHSIWLRSREGGALFVGFESPPVTSSNKRQLT